MANSYKDIKPDISAELGKLVQKFPERFSKPIYVLEGVKEYVNGQWEQRLREAKENQAGERITLIPYNVANSHWIGILLEFKTNEQIERAEFIDPVDQSQFVPDKFQKQFTKIYPGSILLAKKLQQSSDQQQSARLTVENLIAAVQQAQSVGVEHIFHTNNAPSQSTEEEEEEDEDKSSWTSNVFTGKVSKSYDSEQPPNSISQSLENQDVLDSPMKVQRTEQPIKQCEKVREYDESQLESCEVLKEQLENGLAEQNINDKEELKRRIVDKKLEIQSLENGGKSHLAKRRQNSLSELEQLQLLVDKLESLEALVHSNDDYDILRKELKAGLAEQNISDKEKLKQRIVDKKLEIQSLENGGKSHLAKKRQNSLSELEQLQVLVNKIEARESYNSIDDCEVSKQQFDDSSAEHDKAGDEELDSLSEQIEAAQPLGSYDGNKELAETAISTDILNENVPEENLKNMYKDFSSMPSCAERSIISLLFYVSLKLADNTISLDDSVIVPDQLETEILKELEYLQERVEIEELESTETCASLKTASANIKDKNWKSALTELKQLFKQICPLDMQELLRLVEKVDHAASLMENKDIILFLGGTGSGKSTTIHFLSGSKMVEKNVEGLNHIAPVVIKNPELNKITTSPFARSETRYITPITVNLDDVGAHNGGTIILCDSPGFEDTSGPEVDIANGIGIIKAIMKCTSVKPVILISYKSVGDRCEGLKNLAHTLVGLIPGIKDKMKTFSYIFTKYPANERSTIYASLVNIKKTMSDAEKTDNGFMNFFTHVLRKTEDGVRAIDPINDKPGKILDELVESVAIRHPEEVFKFSITEKSKAIVQEQIRKHQFAIMSATKRSDYEFVKYKLDQLQCLDELLDKDFIKQIRDDCIRHISKHLAEEYQEGINALNRFLMNPTVLNNEDIQQFYVCIEHSKLADGLREKHLGTEVIHNGAFIQNMNQGVDVMLKQLHEKDISDLALKISLDKLKLLSKSFSDINGKYENVCQILAEKFDCIVTSFKSSVTSNEFDKSAIDISTLYKALSVLQDHLNRKDMETKYVELKEYFLKYLNDSTENVIHIFNQERLEKTDIDSLKSCICILEAANNTFALQPHISKEAINEIYLKFSLKITNYFDEIVKRINKEFEKKDSFHTLEKLITESDSIKTIFSWDSKTTESYFNTMGKLIGYINESKRDVEELLKALFRREENVNYDKLSKCLSSLKSAQWIEKYQPGLCADVLSDIKKQLNHHIEESKEYVMKADLDLDNSEKIEHVAKIVSEINQMKYIEVIVTDVNEYIDTVNSWFTKTTNDVFIIIKNTFSVEKWKEQGCQTLDFNKAEKAFHYLDACKKVRILCNSDCTSVLNSLEQFIRYFSDTAQVEMGNYFENIKQYENKDKEEMFRKARLFASRLQEITEIKTIYPRVFSCFANKKIVEVWQNELVSYLVELSDEMGKLSITQRFESLSLKLLVAKALSKLDSFLIGQKYIDIYNKYQSIFFSQATDVSKQVMDTIKNADYERVSFEMAALQASSDVGEHFFQQVKRALNVGLDNLMEETMHQSIMLGSNIERDEVKPIVANLKRMQKAKQFISQYLAKPNEIDECIENIKTSVAERINRFLEGVKALITINNFCEADKKIESITLVRTLLGNYCKDDVFAQIQSLKERLNDVVSIDVVKRYSEMDISTYTMNPPTDIFDKFKEVNNTNPIYSKALNTIKEAIVTKFRAKLELAKSDLSQYSENIHIRQFESAVKYLPEAMRSPLEVELKHCKDDIDRLIRITETKLDQPFANGNLKSIRDILKEYQESGNMQYYVNKGRERILKQSQELALKITQHFQENNIAEALNNVKRLYEYKIELEDIVTEIRQTCSDIRYRIRNIFQDAHRCFTNGFLNNNISVVTNETVETVKKNFTCLIEFMKFISENQGQPILVHMLPEDFNESIVVLNKSVLQYFTDYQKKYKDALDRFDIISLRYSLDTTNQWDSLFILMKGCNNIFNINDFPMNTVLKTLVKLPTYPQMLELISHRIQELRDELINIKLLDNDAKKLSMQRDKFYKDLPEKFSILKKIRPFCSTYHVNIDINKIEEECLASLKKKILIIGSDAEAFIEKFSRDCKFTRQDYDDFDLQYSCLISFRQEMNVNTDEINDKIKKIDKAFFDKIQTWEHLIENQIPSEIATLFIQMKRTSNSISSFRTKINEKIDELLNQYKTARGSTNLAKLGALLNRDVTGIGQSIISEHKAFQGYSLSLFNEKTQKHGMDYVLHNLSGDSIDKDQLKKRYAEFRAIYEQLVKQHLENKTDLNKLISDTKLTAANIKQWSNCIEWDAVIRDVVPKLTAYVFALWTLRNADHYFDAKGLEDQNNYLLQPHAAQVISVFRMLGIGDTKEELKNNLVQIGTGEGKSVTLGATATILALLGFDVYCACYSEYLSRRDSQAFRPFFDTLDLLECIHYGTFNKLCEDMVNGNGDIRQQVENIISTNSNTIKQHNILPNRAKILLIDEVDVFFSRDFYGNVYIPAASLQDPAVTALVKYIWMQRQRCPKLNLNQLKATADYKACCKRYPHWESLIQEAVKDMLFDVHNFESHDYVVSQDKIGYIEQDNIVYNVAYGYKTLFAYHFEHEKGKISKKSLEENIGIRIKCGNFSYAEVPLEFQYIMGVTGTLQTLSEPEKRIIQAVYKINKNTFTPSVFGKNNLKFSEKDDITIENENDYYNVIRREIGDRLAGKASEKRAVLVIFESKDKLKKFYESKALEEIKQSVSCLTEEASLEEKENIIKRATTAGQITLFTRTFGRGTDFICYDQNVASSGGVHVIQTFLSEEVSEEVQIKGRTARQGEYGSYSMVLLDRDLETFQIEKEDIEDVKRGKGILVRLADKLTSNTTYDTVYDLLNEKRIHLFKTQYEANMKYVEQAKERHKISQNFLSNLNSGEIDLVKKFLVEVNKGVNGVLNSRTVCLMDATSSMSHLLHKCKNTVDIMFGRASEILRDNRIHSDSFQIQFVVYRNYNSRESKMLQSSPWETKPDNLRTFINTVNAEGGWGSEAVEIGLWHANEENDRESITQVILIGDAPPNLRGDVHKKREKFGENYWTKTKFLQPTYYEDELAKLISNKIPVHTFYVADRAKPSFGEIAERTGGRCESLDINSSLGAQMLTDLVTVEILRNVGGSSNGNALVQAYWNKFGGNHI